MGIVKNLEVEAYDVKGVVDFQVMLAGLEAYPIILGTPWLRAVGAIQDWRRGTISLHGKRGDKKKFDMDSRKPMEEANEDESDLSDEESSSSLDLEEDSDTSTTIEEEVDVAFILLEEGTEMPREDLPIRIVMLH